MFDLMDTWIERYRARAEERYRRLDAVLAQMNDKAEEPRRKGDGVMNTFEGSLDALTGGL